MPNGVNVNVAILIGDIYETSEIPEYLFPMARVFRYDKTTDISVCVPVGGLSVKMTALSISRYDEQMQAIIDRIKQIRPSRSESKIYQDSIRTLVNQSPNSPVFSFNRLDAHIAVIGQTPLFEEVAIALARGKKSIFEPLMIRFSSFYSGASIHSGRSAKSVGFNLDLPKNLFLLFNLLTFEPFIRAVMRKNEGLMMNVLDVLNRKEVFRGNPIIVV